eukprot:Skav211756  [mRNA]  locus=scaffold674:50318:53567:+ [translate_table: standard]
MEPPDADPHCDSGVSLDAALAGLGIGRKQCRMLRAELRLEDDAQHEHGRLVKDSMGRTGNGRVNDKDSFVSLQRYFQRDPRRVESAVQRLLPKACEQASPPVAMDDSIEGADVEPVPNSSESEFEEAIPL